jgi:hypothetical protein
MRRRKGWFITISAILIVGSVMQAAVRGHDSMYVGGTLKGIRLGQKGQLSLEDRPKKIREPVPREKKLEDEIQRLKQSLANRALEVDFFTKVSLDSRYAL